MRNFFLNLRAFVSGTLLAALVLLPAVCLLFAMCMLRVGTVDNAHNEQLVQCNDFYYCIKSSEIPETDDVIMYYDKNTNRKIVSIVKAVEPEKARKDIYYVTVIDNNGNETEIYASQIWGKAHIINFDLNKKGMNIYNT